jgi:hypothetical protein
VGDSIRIELDIKKKLREKKQLLRNIRVSLSADLDEPLIDCHPAVIAQGFYIKALQWVLAADEDINTGKKENTCNTYNKENTCNSHNNDNPYNRTQVLP